jgi:hypothetical protein
MSAQRLDLLQPKSIVEHADDLLCTGTAVVLGQRSSCIFAQPQQNIVETGVEFRGYILNFGIQR